MFFLFGVAEIKVESNEFREGGEIIPMENSDILYCVQKKLIDDLSLIVKDVKQRYNTKISNSWIFDSFDELLKGLQPARVESAEGVRQDLEAKLQKAADKTVNAIQNHIPEVNAADTSKLISSAGSIIYARAEAELAGLKPKSSQYDNAEQLIEAEFQQAKGFSSDKEHHEWLTKVSGSLGDIFDYVEDMGRILNEKRGFGWKIKLAIAKTYLQARLGISLDLPRLAEDTRVIKKAVIENYQQYENRLIAERFKY